MLSSACNITLKNTVFEGEGCRRKVGTGLGMVGRNDTEGALITILLEYPKEQDTAR